MLLPTRSASPKSKLIQTRGHFRAAMFSALSGNHRTVASSTSLKMITQPTRFTSTMRVLLTWVAASCTHLIPDRWPTRCATNKPRVHTALTWPRFHHSFLYLYSAFKHSVTGLPVERTGNEYRLFKQ